MKPSRPVVRAAAPEDAAMKAASFINSRREQLASSILYNLIGTLGKTASNADAKRLVPLSVEMADEMIAALYGPEGKEGAIALATKCFGPREKADETPEE